MPELFNPHGGQPPEAAAVRLAGTQFGRLSVPQLERLGFTRRMIDRRVEAGLWTREHRGVIRLDASNRDYRGRCWGAQLAYGPETVISHHSAAAIWGALAYDGPVHITLPQSRSSRRGTITHESRTLTSEAIRIHFGLRTTNPLRTLIDLADCTPDLEPIASEFQRLGYLQRHALNVHVPGRKGLFLAPRMTRSQLERAFLNALRAATDIPTPETNVRMHGFEADFFWPAHKLVVEIDTYLTHGDRLTFERDRRKQTAFALAGLTTLRVTEETLPRAVADIRAFISDRSGRL